MPEEQAPKISPEIAVLLNQSQRARKLAQANERPHHPCSPSSLQSREASPCFVPDSGGDTRASERGTLQHGASESGNADHEELTDEEAIAVAQTLALEDAAIRRMGGDSAIVMKEAYWPLDNRVVVDDRGNKFEGSTGGYSDTTIFSADATNIVVQDWKFGQYSVEPAKTNVQGYSYALGAIKAARDQGKHPKTVTVEFFSPHISDLPSSHTFTEADFPKMLLRVKTIVARVEEANKRIKADPDNIAHYTPTVSTCIFCARIGACPAVAKFILMAGSKYKPLEFPLEDIHGFRLTDPAKASLGIAASAVAVKWAKSYRKRVTDKAIEDERFIPDDYNLTPSFPRKVVDVKKAFDIGVAEVGRKAAWELVDIPITKFEEIVSKNAPRGEKEAAVEAFGAKLEEAGAVEKPHLPVWSLRRKRKTPSGESAEE